MIYLSGAVREEWYGLADFGFMLQPGMGNKVALDECRWAADNGCFSQVTPFNERRWLAWLARHASCAEHALFAVAPDVVGDAMATERRALPWVPVIRSLGYRAAYVAQDGLTPATTPWEAVDVLFVGGSTDWKLSAAAQSLVTAAIARNIPVHMGRVNSFRRLLLAADMGCASADGTFLTFGPATNLPKLQRWLRHINGRVQLSMLPQSQP